jgi:hypothetical protein
VFLDGFTSSDIQAPFKTSCFRWLERNFEKRRLVIISSLSTRGKSSEDNRIFGVEEFFVCSWMQDEFRQACAEDSFFFSIAPNLDSSLPSTSPATRDALVDSKHHFSGGSMRFFADYSTADVIRKVDEAIEAVSDLRPYLDGSIGLAASNVINRLIGCFIGEDGWKKRCVISRFAAIQFALKIGPKAVLQLAQALHQDSNPSMDGWFLEMWFFATIRVSDLVCKDVETNELVTFKQHRVDSFDPNSEGYPISGEYACLKPIKWNQGGFDAMFVTRSNSSVQFVQVASGKTHTFFLNFFDQAFKNLNLVGKNTSDVFFLTNNEGFVIGDTQGKFSAFANDRVSAQTKARILLVDVKF